MERNLDEAFKEDTDQSLPPVESEAQKLSWSSWVSFNVWFIEQGLSNFPGGSTPITEGDWSGYGESIKELEAILLELQKVSGNVDPLTEPLPAPAGEAP